MKSYGILQCILVAFLLQMINVSCYYLNPNDVTTYGSVNDRYYPRYHLAPPFGWMNDPNGFCIYQNKYHLFYQYNPGSSLNPGIAHWGHAVSEDLVQWKHYPIAMFPDEWYDKSGVFSGSALVEGNTMYIVYTGHLIHENKIPKTEEHQALAVSTDGIHVKKYKDNPIIYAKKHQPDIRDPKIWKHEDTYYMVLGNSFNNGTLGQVLLYSSKDLISWNEVSVLAKSSGPLGYMWECPDFFEIDGLFVLLFSPQGIKPDGDNYNNLYQTGYFIGTFDYKTGEFKILTEFKELDHGHDFYATQTILDGENRRIVVAWFDMWDQVYPERADGWCGLIVTPRVLTISLDGRLLQQPIKEINEARHSLLYSGKASGGTTVTLDNNAGEINIRAPMWKDLELFIEGHNNSATVKISYSYEKKMVSLDRGGVDGVRRTKWHPWSKLRWRIFIDASSIELFCGHGEITFSSRFFPDGFVQIRLGEQSSADEFQVYSMKETVPKP